MPPTEDPPVTESPVYWFVMLDMAVYRRDFAQAARAQRELARLGITVTYKRPRKSRQPAEEVAHE
jgi:hypothetical protein